MLVLGQVLEKSKGRPATQHEIDVFYDLIFLGRAEKLNENNKERLDALTQQQNEFSRDLYEKQLENTQLQHKQQQETERAAGQDAFNNLLALRRQVHAATPSTPASKTVAFGPNVPNTDSGKNKVHHYPNGTTVRELPTTAKKPAPQPTKGFQVAAKSVKSDLFGAANEPSLGDPLRMADQSSHGNPLPMVKPSGQPDDSNETEEDSNDSNETEEDSNETEPSKETKDSAPTTPKQKSGGIVRGVLSAVRTGGRKMLQAVYLVDSDSSSVETLNPESPPPSPGSTIAPSPEQAQRTIQELSFAPLPLMIPVVESNGGNAFGRLALTQETREFQEAAGHVFSPANADTTATPNAEYVERIQKGYRAISKATSAEGSFSQSQKDELLDNFQDAKSLVEHHAMRGKDAFDELCDRYKRIRNQPFIDRWMGDFPPGSLIEQDLLGGKYDTIESFVTDVGLAAANKKVREVFHEHSPPRPDPEPVAQPAAYPLTRENSSPPRPDPEPSFTIDDFNLEDVVYSKGTREVVVKDKKEGKILVTAVTKVNGRRHSSWVWPHNLTKTKIPN
ncbi:MAG: hypothetical protein SGARI_002920 [Bacillariaceae sp.]